MSRSPLVLPATLLLAVVGAAPAAHADRRAFTHTYQYMSMPEGETELEFYSTQAKTDTIRDFQFQLEVEHGITDHWDVSLYQVFEQTAGPDGVAEPLHFAETKLRSRYRLAERGELPVDTLFYGEVAKAFDKSEWELEGKVILARDLGPLTAVANLIGEVKIEAEAGEREAVFIPAWAVGATYEVMPAFAIGAESFGELEPENDERELVLAAGPAMSWAPSPDLWLASTLAFGIEHAADLELRFILGLHL